MNNNNNSLAKLLPMMLCFFAMGFVDLVGIASNYVKADLNLTDSQANIFPSLVFFWFLIFSVPTGMLMNRIGRKKTVLLSLVVTFASLLLPVFGDGYALMLISFSLLGIGNALMQTSLNPLLSNVVSGERLASSLTFGQFVKAIASFLAPYIAMWGATQAIPSLGMGWRVLFPIYMVIAVVAILWLGTTSIHEEKEEGRPSTFGECLALLGKPFILLCFLGIMCHVGIDVGTNTTAPKILMERLGMSLADAGFATSLYFIFRTAGCFLGAFILQKLSARTFFGISVLCMLVAMVGLFVFHEIESLVAEYPMDSRYQVVLGDVYMQNGKKEEAYNMYRKVLDAEPDNAMAMYSLASYYEETGQKDLYQQQLDTLLLNKKVPSETKLNVMRQFVVQNEQDGKDSTRVISLFDRILEQEPDDAGIPMLYAQYLLSKGMNKEAFPVLRQVLAIDPTNTAARMMLLGEAVRKEDYNDVIDLCEAGVETNPEMLEFYFYLAIAYNQAERTDNVISICQKALTQITADSKKEVVSDFYSILGDAYHTKDLNTEAYAAYDSALVYNPSNIGALNNYAYYLSVERRNLDKAEEMSYKTVKAEPDNATYLDTYAWILFEKGNYAEARLYIDDAMKSDGGKSDVIVEHCGDIYYMTGDVDKALEYWNQALKIGSKSRTLQEKIRKKKYISDK